MLAELLAPGLISVFIGLGALTVAGAIHYGNLTDISSQILVWFIASLIYVSTLRILVLKFYPQDVVKGVVDEDEMSYGKIVKVVEDIPANGLGRIYYSDSTWQAKSADNTPFSKGESVCIQARDNITYIVVKQLNKEQLNKEGNQ